MAVGAGLPFLAAGIIQTNSLVNDVSSRAMTAAAGPKVEFDGRDAIMSGEVASQEALDTARNNVAATYGVRLVDVANLKIVAPPPPPPPPAPEPVKVAPTPLMAPTVKSMTTNNSMPMIMGTYPAEAAKLMVSVGAKTYTLGTSPELTTDKPGSWMLMPTVAMPDGPVEVTAKVESADGTVSAASAASAIVVDTVAPEAPSMVMAPADAVWPYAITGKWPEMPGNSLEIDFNKKAYALGKDRELISDGKGQFTFVPTDQLAPGKYDLNMSVTDAAGNVAKYAGPAAIVVAAAEAPAPVAPPKPEAVKLVAPTVETVVSENGNTTVKGTWAAVAGQGLSVSIAGKTAVLGKDDALTSDANGNWTLKTNSNLGDGNYDVVAKVTDGQGNAVSDASTAELTVKTPPPPPPPPPAPKPVLPAPTVETSTSDSDRPTVKGTWSAGLAKSLVVELDGVKHKLGTDSDLLSDASGHWMLKPAKAVVNGVYDVVATATDGEAQSVSDTTKGELTVNVAAPPPPPPVGQPYNCEATLARIAAVFPVRFETDKWDLQTPYDLAVNQYAALLNDPRCGEMRINIVGNADSRGTFEHNQILSENRAKTVVDALTSRGIQLYRLNGFGVGEDKPLDLSPTEDALRRNRRAEFTVAK